MLGRSEFLTSVETELLMTSDRNWRCVTRDARNRLHFGEVRYVGEEDGTKETKETSCVSHVLRRLRTSLERRGDEFQANVQQPLSQNTPGDSFLKTSRQESGPP